MRLCRFEHGKKVRVGFYLDDRVVPIAEAAAERRRRTHVETTLPATDDLLAFLPPAGEAFAATREVGAWLRDNSEIAGSISMAVSKVRLLAPFPRPSKLLLLAGNYAEHIREGGGTAVLRERTFPYVFMKPPSTTINHPGAPVALPRVSPDAIDWEVELAVVIGKRCRGIGEAQALEHVAGYTVVNDISDRKYRPNPGREERPKDEFFDWLHGKWHDGFCPMGPCVTSADAVPDPQKLRLTLKVNDAVKQDATTAQQIFPVAATIAFISSWVTLEPGDVIATGTPAGVGNASGTFLRAGDLVEAAIEGIGVLRNTIVKEA